MSTATTEWEELPHGLGRVRKSTRVKESPTAVALKRKFKEEGLPAGDAPSAKKHQKQGLSGEPTSTNEKDLKEEYSVASASTAKKNKKERQSKKPDPKYNYTPGYSPYPDLARPTPDECEEVNRVLAEKHGERLQPKVIPPPSMTHAGCGEVPDLLDGLLRTRMSAATTAANAAMALNGLETTFGMHEGTIHWEAVRQADLKIVEKAIMRGGLAPKKSKDIKEILDTAYNENCTRRDTLLKAKEDKSYGSNEEVKTQVDFALQRLSQNMLSLDHLLELETKDAMLAMMSFPGIAVKTAACVVLFRMQRPSFAVDTHVRRMCQWLGWVPANASADNTFNHGELRVPDHLKYPLHQLFLVHGKSCVRCKAGTSPGGEGWEETVCPIEHLVTRTGKMKSKVSGASKAKKDAAGPKPKKGKGKKKGKKDDEETEESEAELEDDEDVEQIQG